MKFIILILLLQLFNYANANNHNNSEHNAEFKEFLQTIKTKAINQGVSTKTLMVLDNLTPLKRVIKLDKSQAEFRLDFWRYLNSRVSPNRILIGSFAMRQDNDIFQAVYKKYGVPKHILISFWGLESNFGKTTGSFNLVQSLATLAFDKRRRPFFSTQLLTTLKLIDKGILSPKTKSSWAGAIGSLQFMPSNVLAYGIDADGDGKINLWDSKLDIFHSAANFLSHIGWNVKEKWGREILLPKNFDYSLATLKIKKNLQEWASLGVKTINKQLLPKSNLRSSIVLPMGYKGPAFLVYRNFRSILNWNRSILYALSVGIFADRLIGKKLKTKPILDKKVSKNDIKLVQNFLNANGFNVGIADGIVGRNTRAKLRDYQQQNNILADGYIDYDLVKGIKNIVNNGN